MTARTQIKINTAPQLDIFSGTANIPDHKKQDESLTRTVLKKTDSDGSCLAGDGTVIEAACSSYNLMKQEAAQQAHEAAQKQANHHPDCPESKKNLEMASNTHEAVIDRNILMMKLSQPVWIGI